LALVAGAVAGFWLTDASKSAVAAPPPAKAPAAAAPAAPPSDYSQRVVAYIYGTIPITREDLGEYLVARHGSDNVAPLVNKKIIEHACEKRGISVTDAEVEASILADCDTIQIKKVEFINNVIKKKFGKTLYEWKEDIVKPRLLLTKLCKDQITVTDEDVKKAFEAVYGEKRKCRIIIWPDTDEQIALQEYGSLRDEQGFDRKARSQANSALAATGGQIKLIARNSGVNPAVEHAAFSLQPGEVSSTMKTPDGIVVLKMDEIVPPDPTAKFDDKREALSKDVFDKKVAAEIPKVFKSLKEEAKPTPADITQRVIANIFGSIPITREDLGEYLIARHGLDNVELLVNKKIIEHACEKRGITVTDAEIETSILADCEAFQVKKVDFVDSVVKKKFGKTVFEWKEDIVKPRLLMTKLCKDQIKVTDEDLKKAFDAVYGEKRRCRIIIWPDAEERYALQEYNAIRADERGFARKASTQANSTLAANGGSVQPIARNSGVHPAVEHAAFLLQPGEVSSIIKTPEGMVVLKMDEIVPPDTTVKFEDKREALGKGVFDKKITAEIPNAFKRLRDEAKPMFILKKPNDPDKLVEEVEREIMPAGGAQKLPK
jgi:parvulin-like peptidyl-prolyl isomerase